VVGLTVIAAVISITQMAGLETLPETREGWDENDSALLVEALKGTGDPSVDLDVDHPDVATELRTLTASGITYGVWTATGIATMIIIIAPITLSRTPGRQT
jgi:hypothetical protein